MAAPDKGLSGISIWLSVVLLAGIVVLPFLPGYDAEQKLNGEKRAPIGSISGGTKRSDASASGKGTEVVPPGDTAKDAWTQVELTGGLRECLRLLAPIAANIDVAAPVKDGACGSPVPLVLRGLGKDNKVEFRPAPTMNCRLAASLSRWVDTVLQPAAHEELGSPVKRIIGASSYSCRNIYNNPKLSLSEHATGNAVDIVGFITADGRTIKVLTHWGPTRRDIAKANKKRETSKAAAAKQAETRKAKSKASDTATVHKARLKMDQAQAASNASEKELLAPAKTKEAAFLKRLHKGACDVFTTALGPELNEAHRNHFHFDLKQRRRRAVCR